MKNYIRFIGVSTLSLLWSMQLAAQIQFQPGSNLWPANDHVVTAEEFIHATESMQGAQAVYMDFWDLDESSNGKRRLVWLQELNNQFPQSELQIATIIVGGSLEKIRSEVQLEELPFVVVHDPSGIVAQKYDVFWLPSTVVLNGYGQVRVHFTGFRSSDTPKLMRHLRNDI